MEITLLITVFHIIGVALGVGGATVSDLLFFRALADKKISRDELNLLHTLSYVLWAGLAILFLSGIGFITAQVVLTGTSTYLVSAWFWAKMTIVFLLFCNALVMHNFVFPFMQGQVGEKLDYTVIKPKAALLAGTGVVSILSWYSAMVLGVTRGLDLPYLYIINLYLVLLVFGMLVAYFLFSIVVFPAKKSVVRRVAERARTTVSSKEKKRTPSSLVIIGVALLIGLIIISSAWYVVKKTADKYVAHFDGKEHVVCITETAPWFTPEVLSIDVGDTVVWTHCHTANEHSSDTARMPSIFINQVYAHGDEEHDAFSHEGYVHTHPIQSLSGPESFGSDLRPVGHLGEGNEYRFTFTKAGVYTYICPTHPYMKGIIAVGESAPIDSLWPPADEHIDQTVGLPEVSGVGEIWINTQFEIVPGQSYPGTITIINAETWEVADVIADETFNNPHNLWPSPDGDVMYQTQWHSDAFSLIDIETRDIVRTVRLGNAPAHVFPHPTLDRVYVTLNNENRIAVLNRAGDHVKDLVAPIGPHGIWISPDGRHMSVASTLNDKLTVFDLETEIIREVFDLPGLPLATAITHDGRYAMGSSLLEGFVRVIDLETLTVVGDIEVGEMPIWPSPAPDGQHIFVPNSGSNSVSVIDLETLSVVATIPVAAGAHGIIFGPKDGGGYYGYVSHKFARVMSVIDTETFELVGQVLLPAGAWGGNGIMAIPNAYDEWGR